MSEKDRETKHNEGEKEEDEAEEEMPAHRAQERFDPYAILGLDHTCVSGRASITSIRPSLSAAAKPHPAPPPPPCHSMCCCSCVVASLQSRGCRAKIMIAPLGSHPVCKRLTHDPSSL